MKRAPIERREGLDTRAAGARVCGDPVADAFRVEEGIRLVIVYGSTVSGRIRPDSDIDIAVLAEQPITADDKLSLIGRLEGALCRPVDLVDLSQANGEILKQILSRGQVVIKRDASAYRDLLVKMVDQQADFQPLVTRTLLERQRRFARG